MFDDPILTVTGVCTYYGTSQALFDVELTAPRKGGLAILGLNGAGKTTLLKTIVGELLPKNGQVRFDGAEITQLPTHRRIRRGLGYVPQEHSVFGELSVRDNLLVGCITNPNKSDLDEVVVTDTIPLQDSTLKIKKIRQISVSEMLAETIRRINQKESVSSLFMD